MKVSVRDLAKLGIRVPLFNFKSRWESEYASRLGQFESEGKILSWGYERMSFKIGSPPTTKGGREAWYTPDIYIVNPRGQFYFIEIKGRRLAVDAVRMKAYADHYPFPLIVIEKKKGSWVILEAYNYEESMGLLF